MEGQQNFISTRSVTLDGRLSNKQQWQEMTDADSAVLGCTKAYLKHVKHSKLRVAY